MKKLIILIICFCINSVSAQVINFDQVAQRIVNQSLELKPGEHVLIQGSPNDLEIVQALYVAVNKSGGLANIVINFPEAEARITKEVEIDYLKQTNWGKSVLRRMSDCIIDVESVDNPHRWNHVTPELRKAFRKSALLGRRMSQHDRLRIVSVGQTDGIPSRAIAELYDAEYNQLISNFWAAIAVDHDELEKKGTQVTQQLQPKQRMIVKSKYGTNISFQLNDQHARMSCGKTTDQKTSKGNNYAWLPAGDAYTSINPISANGIILMPSYFARGKKYTNLRLEFINGVLEDIAAEQDVQALKEQFFAVGKKSIPLSAINIGLNTKSKVVGDYRSFEMEGVITLMLGSNTWAGGDLVTGEDLSFHLVDATLSNTHGNKIVDAGLLITALR